MNILVRTLAVGFMLTQLSPSMSFAEGTSCGCKGKHAAGEKTTCTCEKDCKCKDCADGHGSCEHKADKKG
jgi:hypothetical protein